MKKILLIGTVCFLFVAVKAHATVVVEAACTAAGTNCLCSEPMDTSTYTAVSTNVYTFDGSTKACQHVPGSSGFTDGSLVYPTNFGPVSSGEAINALPSGHTVTRVLALPNGQTGGLVMGHGLICTQPRCESRWYVYHLASTNFQDGGCQNTKIATGAGIGQVFTLNDGSSIASYSFLTPWTPGSDCCNYGPGTNPGLSAGYWIGHWVRVSFVLIHATGAGATTAGAGPVYQVYAKQAGAAENTEIKIIDTSDTNQAKISPGDGRFIGTQNMTAGGAGVGLAQAEFYVQNSVPGCLAQGSQAFSSYMASSWATNSGQRIGAATEIEGGTTTSNTPPNAPTALGLH